MNNIWIVVLTYNGLEDTRRCLTSVAAVSGPGVTRLLVDNGSTDGTAAIVAKEFPWCRVLTVTENRGPAAGYNAGVRAALAGGADGVVLLNNDTVVAPELVTRLRQAAAAHPEYSIIGPVIKFMDDPEQVMTDGFTINSPQFYGFFHRKPVELTESAPPRVTDVDAVNGCCVLIRAAVFERIGLFDEQIFIYHDETDFCLRALGAGFKAGVIDHALVWHKGSATFQSSGKRLARYYDARNLLYVLRKHGGLRHNGRSRLASAIMYARYMYHWYCTEREAGYDQSADAVIEGVWDGALGRMGRYRDGRRRVTGPVRAILEMLRRLPRGRAAAVAGHG